MITRIVPRFESANFFFFVYLYFRCFGSPPDFTFFGFQFDTSSVKSFGFRYKKYRNRSVI